ncbi:MAG: CHAT domain-containing protein [Anaerolineae bacterium]|nr:CHAT domain-containing protein [Anaerolineae bacterium]
MPRSRQVPIESDLEILGGVLIPAFLQDQLTPNTLLLLAPHRELHTVPWAALPTGDTNEPLVNICLPVVVPSMNSLMLLWQRAIHPQPAGAPAEPNGLIVSLSEFQPPWPSLPSVKQEVIAIKSHLGLNGKELPEGEATWKNLVALTHPKGKNRGDGLRNFSFLHVASHIFSDPHTGRLSGVILADSEIWVDRWRDLAPLPALVTLSACNGTQSLIYLGDEPVGLPITCLVAGAERVIGSIWPVQDHAAAELMTDFYTYWATGKKPAEALAMAQRAAFKRGAKIDDWASLICFGVP